MPYLYGASIQGIQSFIFETNMLKEIAGASELIESLCSRESISQLLGESSNTLEWLLNAAGNIRFTTKDKDTLSAVVLKWPKIAASKAPGITISQAVVFYEDALSSEHFDELEGKIRTQRSFSAAKEFPGYMALERSRRTGKPAISRKSKYGGALADEGTMAKHEANKKASSNLMLKIIPDDFPVDAKNKRRFPFDLSDITGVRDSSWIAVIHADGNDLGKVIRMIADAHESGVNSNTENHE